MPFSQTANDALDAYLTAKARYEQAQAAHAAGQIVNAIIVSVAPKDPSNPTHVQLATFAQNNIDTVLDELSGRVVDRLRRDLAQASEALVAAVQQAREG